MPVTVSCYTDPDQFTLEQCQQIVALYETSPEFGDGEDALKQLKTAMSRGDEFFTAEFNDKMIGAVWSRGQGETHTLQYIVTHPANRGRGIAETLISQACEIDNQKGVQYFLPGCGAIQRILKSINRLS